MTIDAMIYYRTLLSAVAMLGGFITATSCMVYLLIDAAFSIPGIHLRDHGGVVVFGLRIGYPSDPLFLPVCAGAACVGLSLIAIALVQMVRSSAADEGRRSPP